MKPTDLTDIMNVEAMQIITKDEAKIIKERMDLWRNKKL